MHQATGPTRKRRPRIDDRQHLCVHHIAIDLDSATHRHEQPGRGR